MGVFSPEECTALVETMYENYNSVLTIEVETMIDMVETGFMPAFASDLSIYKDAHNLAGERSDVYSKVKNETAKLKKMFETKPDGLEEEAHYLCDHVKPQMAAVRACVDQAEGLMKA